ncbi:MAG: hypothetical protein LBG42_00545 [Treponema sp.]|jgi:hypothetical protein|nr:hypothetical protein [Treponema sp.]
MKRAVIFGLCVLSILAITGCGTLVQYTPGGVTDNTVLRVAEGPSVDGVSAIAKQGGITKIATIDYRTTRTYWYWLALFGQNSLVGVKQELIVSGE